MLTLYSTSAASDFTLLSTMPEGDLEILLFNATQLLAIRGHNEAAGLLAAINFEISEGTNNFGDEFSVLHAQVPISQYEFLREKISTHDEASKEFKGYFREIASTISEIGSENEFYIRHIACSLDPVNPPENWRLDLNNSITALTSNQALWSFKDSRRLAHQGLNFRSQTEIKIFEALVKRGVLVFPLPVAVMGSPRAYKEPDFVVCCNGRVGILEIHGDKWHPPETAAKEHDRRRQFTTLGVRVYEIYGADRCWNDTEGVVNEFIETLKSH